MKAAIPVIFVIGASLLLFNVIPTEITVILWLILITLVISKWPTLKENFS